MRSDIIVIWLVMGAVSGWLAGQIVRGAGLGLVGDIAVGILGTFVAGYLLPRLGIHLSTGTIGYIIDGAIGSVVVLVMLSLIRRVGPR